MVLSPIGQERHIYIGRSRGGWPPGRLTMPYTLPVRRLHSAVHEPPSQACIHMHICNFIENSQGTMGARCKGQDQHQHKSERDAAATCTTTTDQLRISTGAGGVHDAAIMATSPSSSPHPLNISTRKVLSRFWLESGVVEHHST